MALAWAAVTFCEAGGEWENRGEPERQCERAGDGRSDSGPTRRRPQEFLTP